MGLFHSDRLHDGGPAGAGTADRASGVVFVPPADLLQLNWLIGRLVLARGKGVGTTT